MVKNPKAFPIATCNQYGQRGMDLRDCFAGQALAGVMAYSGNGYGEQSLDAATIASICGQIADAMLAERSK